MLGENAGVMYWQADDTWPGPSWSTIELGGRPKVGHYAVQRAFAPLMVSGRVGSDEQLHVYFSRSDHHAPCLVHLPLGAAAAGTEIVLRITAFRWSGGHGAIELPVLLPAPHSTARLLSRHIDAVLSSISCSDSTDTPGPAAATARPCCSARTECVLGLEVVVPGTAAAATTVAANTVYLSPLHQVTTMVADPGLAVRDVVPAAGGSSSSPGFAVFNVTVTAARTPAALVWLETPLPGRWSDNGVLQTTPTLQLQWTTDEQAVTAAQLAASVTVRSLVDVAAGYSSGGPHRQ